MSSEDEIGQDVDRLVRTALMAAGQIREHVARHQQTNAWAQQQQMAAAVAEHREHTQLVYDRVRREEFWQQASPGQVADLTAFTSTIAPYDARGREAHDVMREQLRSRFGVDLDAIAAAHTDPADRRNALVHALDDYKASLREDAEAREDLTLADHLEDRAAHAPASDRDGAERDLARADDAREDADEHLEARDRLLDEGRLHERAAAGIGERAEQYARVTDRELVGVAPVAAQARREAATNFPQSANAALRSGRSGRRTHRPKPAGAARAIERGHELSR